MTSELKASFLRKAKENTEVEVRLGENSGKVKGISIKVSYFFLIKYFVL